MFFWFTLNDILWNLLWNQCNLFGYPLQQLQEISLWSNFWSLALRHHKDMYNLKIISVQTWRVVWTPTVLLFFYSVFCIHSRLNGKVRICDCNDLCHCNSQYTTLQRNWRWNWRWQWIFISQSHKNIPRLHPLFISG